MDFVQRAEEMAGVWGTSVRVLRVVRVERFELFKVDELSWLSDRKIETSRMGRVD